MCSFFFFFFLPAVDVDVSLCSLSYTANTLSAGVMWNLSCCQGRFTARPVTWWSSLAAAAFSMSGL